MNRKDRFGTLVKEARERAGLRQGDLGERIGVGASTLSKYENGSFTYPPDPEVLEAIERELGVSKIALSSALGYVDPAQEDHSEWDALPASIRELLADIDWSPQNTVRAKTMLETIRDTQRPAPPDDLERLRTMDVSGIGPEGAMRIVPVKEDEHG